MDIKIYFTFAFGGLLGSIITIVVKAFIDERQKVSENKRLIKKIYFENKLKAAETAISIWHSARTYFNSLSGSFDSISKPDKVFNYEVFKKIVSNADSNLQKLADSLIPNGNTIILYHDIDSNEHWKDDDNQRFFELTSDAAELNDDLLFYLEEHEKAQGEQKKAILKLIEETTQKNKAKLKEISLLYKKAELFYKEAISTIRNEIAKEIK